MTTPVYNQCSVWPSWHQITDEKTYVWTSEQLQQVPLIGYAPLFFCIAVQNSKFSDSNYLVVFIPIFARLLISHLAIWLDFYSVILIWKKKLLIMLIMFKSCFFFNDRMRIDWFITFLIKVKYHGFGKFKSRTFSFSIMVHNRTNPLTKWVSNCWSIAVDVAISFNLSHAPVCLIFLLC